MARGRQAQQALLPPLPRRQADPETTACRVAEHQCITKRNSLRTNTMELLDRYEHADSFALPKAKKQDIIAELSEDIRSQIEEKEAELGRKLNDAEVEDILKQLGRPVLVANRYAPRQYLIGPVLFPIYRFVLELVALCYLVPWVLVWIGLMTSAPGYRAAHFSGGWIGALASLW